jgi:hypothetical protein
MRKRGQNHFSHREGFAGPENRSDPFGTPSSNIEESAVVTRRYLAFDHVDMMFHVFCDRGYPVKLDKAAQALGIPGKPEGMSGLLAPQLWAQGRYQEVLDYVAQDVRIALQIARVCEQRRRFQWTTQRGKVSLMDLPRGWLTVREAIGLPPPDTSWMDHAIPRHAFTNWLNKDKGRS